MKETIEILNRLVKEMEATNVQDMRTFDESKYDRYIKNKLEANEKAIDIRLRTRDIARVGGDV